MMIIEDFFINHVHQGCSHFFSMRATSNVTKTIDGEGGRGRGDSDFFFAPSRYAQTDVGALRRARRRAEDC